MPLQTYILYFIKQRPGVCNEISVYYYQECSLSLTLFLSTQGWLSTGAQSDRVLAGPNQPCSRQDCLP